MLGERDLVETSGLEAGGRLPALLAVAVLQAVQDRALLRRAAELGAARLDLGLEAIEGLRGLLARGAGALHPRLCGKEVVPAARAGGGAARRLLGGTQGQLGVLQHRLATQTLAEAGGKRLLGNLLVVLAQLAQALEAEVVALHLSEVVGSGARGFSRWTDGRYPRRVRLVVLLAALLLAAGCGSAGTVSNDDDVSRKAATDAVEQFFTKIHADQDASACAQLPGQQRGGLGRLSKARGGPATCEGALRTLKEFAPARGAGPLTFGHDIGFRGALPHTSKEALDKVTVDGHQLGAVGLKRTGDAWNVVLVCECP
jgi:hypothetical protein